MALFYTRDNRVNKLLRNKRFFVVLFFPYKLIFSNCRIFHKGSICNGLSCPSLWIQLQLNNKKRINKVLCADFKFGHNKFLSKFSVAENFNRKIQTFSLIGFSVTSGIDSRNGILNMVTVFKECDE